MSKVLLITGASRGIGAETARLAAEHGYSLCLNYLHNEAVVTKLLESLQTDGHHAITYQANVGVEAEVEAMYQAIDREFGRLEKDRDSGNKSFMQTELNGLNTSYNDLEKQEHKLAGEIKKLDTGIAQHNENIKKNKQNSYSKGY